MDDKYSVSQVSVNVLLAEIESKQIAIPDIQRPFVWKGWQVRDLIDSLYNGYPTGYLIVWQNPDVKLKDGKVAAGKKLLIDGQQRVTALMTAIAGVEIINDKYQERTISIAFNPLAQGEEEHFAVTTAAHKKSKFWIPDISVLFKPDFKEMKFIKQYEADNPGIDEDLAEDAITRLIGIKNCQLGVINLVSSLDIDEVTNIFVRINSKGTALNAADFAMSRIAADDKYGGNNLRKAIDYFCHLATAPEFWNDMKADHDFMNSGYAEKIKWLKDDSDDIYDPGYSDMLRVSFMHKFGRGKLSDLVSLLSGRDFEERTYKESIVQDSFQKLSDGVCDFINEYNFKQFIVAIRAAGFVTPKLLGSNITLDFAYTLFLLLQKVGSIPKTDIKRYVQKWFVLATLTQRYIGSPESRMDQDLRAIKSKGFLAFFNENETAMLNETFWSVGLPQRFESPVASSPYFKVFLAAQVHDADLSLLSNSIKVSDLIMGTGDVHHIFPKAYLQKNGYNKDMYNQIANYTYLDTTINIVVGDRAPKEYFSIALSQCSNPDSVHVSTITDEKQFWDNLAVNCIPKEVTSMTYENYPEFLQQRRRLMALKIRDYYNSL